MVTNTQIQEFVSQVLADPTITDAQKANLINSAATQYGVTPEQIGAATGYDVGTVKSFLSSPSTTTTTYTAPFASALTPTRAAQDWEAQYGLYNQAPIFSANVIDKALQDIDPGGLTSTSYVYKNPAYNAGANINAASSFVRQGASLFDIVPQYSYGYDDSTNSKQLTGYSGDLKGTASKLGIDTKGLSDTEIYNKINDATKDVYSIGYVNPSNPYEGTEGNFQQALYKKVGDRLVAISAPKTYTGTINPGGESYLGGIIGDALKAAPLFAAAYFGGPYLNSLFGEAGALSALDAGMGVYPAVDLGAAGAAGTAGGFGNAALDAQFIAADASQLAGQGLSQAAIEQNLVAAGVDAFTAADAAQLALQGISQSQMTGLLQQSSGGASSLFGAGTPGLSALDAGMNVYPTENISEAVGGAAGLAGAAGAGGAALTGYDAAMADLAASAPMTEATVGGLTGATALKALAGGAALLGGAGMLGSALGGGRGGVSIPGASNLAGVSTGSAQYSPEYYQQLQQYYNTYMPTQPRDVSTPLQKWYETKFTPETTVTDKLFGVK